MVLERADRIRDDGISRGIGSSPLVSQEIRRGLIEEESLQKAVAESRATQANREKSRKAEFLADQLKRSRNFRGAGSGRGSASNSRDQAFLNIIGSESTRSVFEERDSFGRSFVVTFADGGNIKSQKVFRSAGEAVEFARSHGIRLEVPGTPSLRQGELEFLQREGVGFTTVGEARKTVDTFVKPGISESVFRSSLGRGRRGRGAQTDSRAESISALKYGAGDGRKVDFNQFTRNERARIVDSAYSGIVTSASNGDARMSALRGIVNNAFKQGIGGSKIMELINGGYLALDADFLGE